MNEEWQIIKRVQKTADQWDDLCKEVKEFTEHHKLLQSLTITQVLEMIDLARIEVNESKER